MLAWKICLKRLLTVPASKGPRLAATSASSISCSRTGSYCEAPSSVCSAPISAAASARRDSSSSRRRFSSSISARRLRIFSSIVHPIGQRAPLGEPDDHHGQLEEHQQRDRHEGEVEGVAGGGDERRRHQPADDG